MFFYITLPHGVLEVRKTWLKLQNGPYNEHNILVKPLHVCIWVAAGSVVGIAGYLYLVQGKNFSRILALDQNSRKFKQRRNLSRRHVLYRLG